MYVGYTVLFCCSFSLSSSTSLFPSLYSEPSFYPEPHSHFSLLFYRWKPLVIYSGAELCEYLSKKEKKICQVPRNYTRIKSILTHYPSVLLSPKCSCQFLQTHIHFSSFSPPRPPNERVRNHRINWAKSA